MTSMTSSVERTDLDFKISVALMFSIYSSLFMAQFYIHEYSRYKTEIIHEYSGTYTMNSLELF